MKKLALRLSAVAGALVAPAVAFAQTAGTEPTVTASGLLGTSGADVTQVAATVGLMAAPILLTALGWTVIRNIKKGTARA